MWRTLTSKIFLLVLSCLALTACKDGDALTPRSGGRAFEVMVVADRDSVLTHYLAGLREEPLPQPEQLFDLSLAKRLDGVARVARSIVILEEDAKKYNKVQLRYDRNVYASPQLIVYVQTPSVVALRRFLRTNASLKNLLLEQEMVVERKALKKKHNAEASKATEEQFGVSLLVPADLTAMKRGKDFLWMSDDGGAANRSICVYWLSADKTLSQDDILAARDSIMRMNIPGERAGTYMQTCGSVSWQESNIGGQPCRIARGLWQIKGDAMGGPFVLHIISVGGRWLAVEAFVYAPGAKKRNRLRLLEAALYTTQPKN